MTASSMGTTRRLLVLDDDPTGSQCVAGVDVAFQEDPAIPAEVLRNPGATCFVLMNTRALPEAEAVAKNRRILSGVLGAGLATEGLHVVSRSDSTLRGHVLAEPSALADVLAEHGVEVDGFLFCPAMIEAGRFTKDDVHYAMVQGQPLQAAETDFAKDATFGYTESNLRNFLEERSEGRVRADEVASIGLEDIRQGGVERVEQILAGVSGRQWVVVNATDYADMEVVTAALARREAQGRSFITRCGPSFVRPLSGQRGATVLTASDITIDSHRASHGLVVVGSHVGLTTRQLTAVQRRGNLAEFELEVPRLLDPATRQQHLEEVGAALRTQLSESDCVVYTSRDLVRTDSKDESLQIARQVSDAVVQLVASVASVHPAWVVAKGGITSHEVAAQGLGISHAEVKGQFFPGQVSLFTALQAPAETIGMPYVVFPGNVGGDEALADAVERLVEATRQSRSEK
ncbi:four-carbon acid sugar kinase family protein [Luteococcus sp. H138]|uniref:four-carbon acid sugar kinase family protein n=1 Tax=unclassified Luteococcus TaxID=2639923 RepID=UPI00313BFB61